MVGLGSDDEVRWQRNDAMGGRDMYDEDNRDREYGRDRVNKKDIYLVVGNVFVSVNEILPAWSSWTIVCK